MLNKGHLLVQSSPFSARNLLQKTPGAPSPHPYPRQCSCGRTLGTLPVGPRVLPPSYGSVIVPDTSPELLKAPLTSGSRQLLWPCLTLVRAFPKSFCPRRRRPVMDGGRLGHRHNPSPPGEPARGGMKTKDMPQVLRGTWIDQDKGAADEHCRAAPGGRAIPS